MSFFRRTAKHEPHTHAPAAPEIAQDETVSYDESAPTPALSPVVAAPEVTEAEAVDGRSAGGGEWAGDGSTRQKAGHISGGIAPFVTTLPAFVRGARPPALLVLEDGRTFRGEAYGAIGETHGEAVFNTGMTGYEETLTDPSYYGQVVAMTAPHIGNTGYNDVDPESSRIWVAGFVVRDPARITSNWRAGRTLEDELHRQGIVGISGVDTRALTRHLRERGAMRVGISSAELDPQSLLDRVLASPGMSGADLAPFVSTIDPYVVPARGERRYTVAALDLGIKSATPRYMSERGCDVHVLPAASSAADLLAVQPDGVFVSNGPGDPAAMNYAVDALRGVLDADVPMFGICFGNQILGRAFGLSTYKLRYGHRGINQPVKDRATGRVHVTSHNHGFAVQADVEAPMDTPYGRVEVSHIGLNDGVVEGLNALDRPAFSVQYHPESAAGPHDAVGLFTRFTELMDSRR
jgi:carbamoyl-phosphate synthase small subunit